MDIAQNAGGHARRSPTNTRTSWPFSFPLPSPPSSVPSTLVASFCHGCTRCHAMKRNCSGGMPCDLCWKMDYECVPRRRMKHGETPSKEHRRGHRSGSGGSSKHVGKTKHEDGGAAGGGGGGGGGRGSGGFYASGINEMRSVSECTQSGVMVSTRTSSSPSFSSSSSSSVSSSSSSSYPAASSSLLTNRQQHPHHQDSHRQHQQHDPSFIRSELHFHRQDPRPFASLYLRIFKEMHTQGKISRQRALWMLRTWGIQSALVDADVTWGLAAEVAKTMGITAADIEGKEMLALGPTLEGQRQLAAAAAAKAKSVSKELKGAARFRVLDERDGGRRGIRMALFNEKQLYFFHAANEGYERLFPDPVDGYDHIVLRKSMRMYWEICSVFPEDREQYLRFLLEVSYGCISSGSSQTELLKLVSRTGAIRVFLVKRQHTRRENGEDETVFYLEPAPESRYVTSTPWAYNRTAQIFRRGGFSPHSPIPEGELTHVHVPVNGGGGGGGSGSGGEIVAVRVGVGGSGGRRMRGGHASQSLPSLPPPALPLALCPGVPFSALNGPVEEDEDEKILHMAIMEKRATAIFPPASVPPLPLASSALLSFSHWQQQWQEQKHLHTHAPTYGSRRINEEEGQGQVSHHRHRGASTVVEGAKKKKKKKKVKVEHSTQSMGIEGASSSNSSSPSVLRFLQAQQQQRQGGEGWQGGLGDGEAIGPGNQQQEENEEKEKEEEEEEEAGEALLASLLPILDEDMSADLFDEA